MAAALQSRMVGRASSGAARSIIRMAAVACRGNSFPLARKEAMVESSAIIVVAPNAAMLNSSFCLVKSLSVGSVGTTSVAGTPDAAPVASGETHTFAGGLR